MSTVISNMDDVIDSREITSRRDELQSEYDELEVAVEDSEEGSEERDLADENLNDFNTEFGDELASLNALCHDGENASEDWEWGATLIRDSYLTDYVQEMVEDCYSLKIPDFVEVDWEATARNVRMDYTPIEFDGVTYWVR